MAAGNDYLSQILAYGNALTGNRAGVEDTPGGVNPLAFLLSGRGRGRPSGLGEQLEDEEEADPFSGPDTTRTAPPPGVDTTGTEGSAGPGATGAPGTTGAGGWEGFLENPANRSFMMSMGLQLMSGGWGNWSQQLAAGVGAGASAAHTQERIDRGEVTGATDTTRTGRGRGRGRTRLVDGTGAGRSLEIIRRNSQLAEAEEFINSNPTPESWNVANQPGGLINAVFGGARSYEDRSGLLHQIQDERRRAPPVDARNLTDEEVIALGNSRNPADQLTFQGEVSRRRRRQPRAGYEWYVTPEGGTGERRTTRPPGEETTRGPGRGGGLGTSQIAANTIAAMEAGIISLRDAREALSETNWAQRFIQGASGIGRMADLGPQLNRLARLPMHGVSGAQVNIPETQAYLDSFRPNPLDPRETWERLQFKLDNLEWMLQAMLAARRGGAVTEAAALELRNRMRERIGLRAITVEQHRADQARVGGGPGDTTTTTTPGPGNVPPPTGAQPPGPPRTEPIIPNLPPRPDGTRLQGPDGTRYIRRGGAWEIER